MARRMAMNWSRAKTVLIVLLLAVDIFLLVTYITRENSVRRDELQVRGDVCGILSAQGIYVDEETIPLDSVKIRPAVIVESADMKKPAERIFGAVTESENDGNVAYFGEGGSIMLSGDSFSLVYESGKEIMSDADALRLAGSIASKLYVSTSASELICEGTDGGYIVRVPRFISGVPVFDCGVEVKISQSGSVIASGKFIGKGKLRESAGEVMRTSALMLEFADRIKAIGHTELRVSDMKIGYISKIPASGHATLVPALMVETDAAVFYVDMQTGNLLKV